MKQSGYKSVISLLFVQLILALSVSVYASDVEKKFSKEFDAEGIELLRINNRYGDVEIVSSKGNKINIVVNVQLSHPSESKAERLLSMINIAFSENDNTVEATTEIERQFSMNTRGSDRAFSIDYRVEMPENMNLALSNRYGNINTGDLSGHVDIRIKYGSLFIRNLSRGNKEPLNSITAEYVRTGDIAEAGWLELNMRHVAQINIAKAQALLINSRYSINTKIGEVSSVVIDSQYDKFEIDKLANIVAESAYTSYKLGEVLNKLNIETKYGSIDVEDIKTGFDTIKTDTQYTILKFGFSESASYMLNADTRYCKVSFDEDDADIIQRIQENNSVAIKALVGNNADTKSEVVIDSKYGSVKLN